MMRPDFDEKLARELGKPEKDERTLVQLVAEAAQGLAEAFEANLMQQLFQKEPEEDPPDEVLDAPAEDGSFTHSVNGQRIKIAPFWAFVPGTQAEVDRLSSALEQSSTWLYSNTSQCKKCLRRIPLDTEKCPDCK
jgi:hypothetical protein